MSDIANHHQAISDICAEIPELAETFATAPEKLDSAELPAQYTLTGSGADLVIYGESEEFVRRIYRVQVPVIPIGQATPTIRETRCRELLEIVRRKLKAHPSLKLTNGVVSSKVVSDSGVVVLPEFGMAFVGFEIRLQVEYSELIEFAVGE